MHNFLFHDLIVFYVFIATFPCKWNYLVLDHIEVWFLLGKSCR